MPAGVRAESEQKSDAREAANAQLDAEGGAGGASGMHGHDESEAHADEGAPSLSGETAVGDEGIPRASEDSTIERGRDDE